MVRRRRHDEREIPATRREGTIAPPRPVPAELDGDEEPSVERAAAAIGNRGFTELAREGDGILPGGRAHPDVAAAIAASRGRGRALDPATQATVAPRLGDDLADVRIHDDPEAAGLAHAVSARAFTVGSDIYFDAGEHRPGTPDGDRLMAHELAHVTQQRGGSTTGPLTVTEPGDATEREADATASQVLQRAPKGKPVQTITFGEGEADVVEGHVHQLDVAALGSAEQEIKDQVDRIAQTLRSTQTALLAAIDQFGRDQAFASSSEGKADFDGAFLSWAGEQILGKLLEEVGERVPYFEKVYGLTIGLVKALQAEDERAATARGSRAVAEFLGKYTANVTNSFNAQLGTVQEVKNDLIVQYRSVTAEHPDLATPTAPAGGGPAARPAVAGTAAEFLTKLRGLADAQKPPTLESCLQTIVEGWIAQSAGELKSRGGGDIYVDGRILISMGIMKDGDSYTVTDKPSGKLQAPRADHVIDSLKQVFTTGKTTNDINVLKVATIRVEDEIDWGFNDWYDVRVSFYKRGQIEDIQTIGHPVREERVHRQAPAIEKKVLQMVTFEDLALTDLDAAKEGR